MHSCNNDRLTYETGDHENKAVVKAQFLSDPGPIIVYPCQWLTDSLTNDLVEDWMNWPKCADFADYVDYADFAEYA